MTTSGSYAFNPTYAEILDEAFERAGVDPGTISQRHINSARMSVNLMLQEWAVRDGDMLFRLLQDTETVPAATASFTPVTGTFDIVDMVANYNSAGVDMPMTRMSREDYLNLADKDEQGQPKNYYVDQSTLNAPTVYIWPVPDASTVFTFDCLRYAETPGLLSETMDVHRLRLEALCAGLAFRLAAKYNLDRVALLKPLYDEAYAIARRAGSGSSRVVISGRGFGSAGRTVRR